MILPANSMVIIIWSFYINHLLYVQIFPSTDEVQGNAELPTQSDPEQKSPVHNDIKESHSIPLQTGTLIERTF